MKRFLIFLFIFLSLAGGIAMSFDLWRGKTMALQEVKTKWGNENFDAKKFKEGDFKTKAKMSYSLLKNEKSWIGKDVDEVRSSLGTPDGFYFVDIHPAYIIQNGQTRKDETWQIVFLLDNHYKVKKMFMHLNCCDK